MAPSRRSSPPPIGPAARETPAEPAVEMVRIGRIVGIHGLRGALRYRPDNPESNTLGKVERVTIEAHGARREYKLVAVSPGSRELLRIELEEVTEAQAAATLKDAIVMVAATNLPQLRGGEFYHFRAIGSRVLLTDGTEIGQVEEVFSNGANDVMVVRDGKREVLVPVIEDVVKSIDLEARRIVIEPVPGLLA